MNQVLDDIIVVGRSMEEYLERLAAVLKRLEEYNLRANREICNFLRGAVEYLGHVISTYLIKSHHRNAKTSGCHIAAHHLWRGPILCKIPT